MHRASYTAAAMILALGLPACDGDDDAQIDEGEKEADEAAADEAAADEGEKPDDEAERDRWADLDLDRDALIGLDTLYTDELHDLEHIELPAPGTAVVWIEGETYTFEDNPDCTETGDRFTAGADTAPDEGANFWIYIARILEGGDDYRFEREELKIELTHSADDDRDNEAADAAWSQRNDDEPSGAEALDPPLIRANEDGEITAKGVLQGADRFSGEVEIAMTCELGWT